MEKRSTFCFVEIYAGRPFPPQSHQASSGRRNAPTPQRRTRWMRLQTETESSMILCGWTTCNDLRSCAVWVSESSASASPTRLPQDAGVRQLHNGERDGKTIYLLLRQGMRRSPISTPTPPGFLRTAECANATTKIKNKLPQDGGMRQRHNED